MWMVTVFGISKGIIDNFFQIWNIISMRKCIKSYLVFGLPAWVYIDIWNKVNHFLISTSTYINKIL